MKIKLTLGALYKYIRINFLFINKIWKVFNKNTSNVNNYWTNKCFHINSQSEIKYKYTKRIYFIFFNLHLFIYFSFL